MGAFDKFSKSIKSDTKIKTNIQLESKLYEELKQISDNELHATVTQLIESAIEELYKLDTIPLLPKAKGEYMENHTFLMYKSNLIYLDELKDKYGYSRQRLINISIKLALKDYYKKNKGAK